MKEAEVDFEIEDVLSSIRRLVSQDSRPARVARVSLAPVVEEPSEDSFLVLTPAQRIARSEPARQPDIVAELSRLESSIAEMEAAVTVPEAADVSETVEVPEVVVDSTLTEPLEPSAEAPEVIFDKPEILVAEQSYAAETLMPPVSVMLEPEQVPVDEAAALVDALEDIAIEDVVEALECEHLPEMSSLDAGVDVVPDDDVVSAPDVDTDNDAEVAASAFEAHEPVEELADLAGSEESIEDTSVRVAPQILRPDQFRRSAAPVTEDTDPLFDDAALSEIDADALRNLVAQLIREELRGVLGERITHNVRKLVRREIQRALAGHELD